MVLFESQANILYTTGRRAVSFNGQTSRTSERHGIKRAKEAKVKR